MRKIPSSLCLLFASLTWVASGYAAPAPVGFGGAPPDASASSTSTSSSGFGGGVGSTSVVASSSTSSSSSSSTSSSGAGGGSIGAITDDFGGDDWGYCEVPEDDPCDGPFADPVACGWGLVEENQPPVQEPPNLRADAIAQAYRDCLLRDASPAEIQGWLATPGDVDALRDGICRSPEANRVGAVQDAYQDCLGRAGSNAEIRLWVDNPAATDVLVASICASPEARERAVADAYRRCLGREGSNAEIDGWVRGGLSIPDMVQGICQSPEARRRLVADLYLECLARGASGAEIDGWTSTGLDAQGLRNGICQSDEAKKRRWIAEYYRDCLGRGASNDEIAGWLATGQGRNDLYQSICQSDEGRRHAIVRAYRDCLGRAASPQEIADWLATGNNRYWLMRAICTSDEANARRGAGWFDGAVRANHRVVNGSRYDYFQNSCWSASNNGVSQSPTDTGIIKCDKTLTASGHAFVYVRNPDGTTTYYNWGQQCGPCAGAPPDPVDQSIPSSECNARCIQRFCDDQFGPRTGPMPVGTLLPIEGPSQCARDTFKAGGNLRACNACCDRMADRWLVDAPAQAENYRKACLTVCNGVMK